MGNFSYICPHCGQNIREDELCVMAHLRHSEIIGFTQGHYDGYGRVTEEDPNDKNSFRNDFGGENSHEEICKSEWKLEDSFSKTEKMHVFHGIPLLYGDYLAERALQELEEKAYNLFELKSSPFLMDAYKTNKDKESQVQLVFAWFIKFANAETIKDREICRVHLRDSYQILIRYQEQDFWQDPPFELLPKYVPETYSGIIAYHANCFRIAMKKNTFKLVPSEDDPMQGGGQPRKRFR